MSKNPYNFFCRVCNTVICEDCKHTALEYAELAENHRMALANAECREKELRRENERLQREVKFLRETIQLGFPAIAQTWFNRVEAEQLYQRVLNHNEDLRKMREVEQMIHGGQPIDVAKVKSWLGISLPGGPERKGRRKGI